MAAWQGLFQMLTDEVVTPLEIIQRMNLPPSRLRRMLESPRLRAKLTLLHAIARAKARCVVVANVEPAAKTLAALTCDERAETARKACIDVLRESKDMAEAEAAREMMPSWPRRRRRGLDTQAEPQPPVPSHLPAPVAPWMDRQAGESVEPQRSHQPDSPRPDAGAERGLQAAGAARPGKPLRVRAKFDRQAPAEIPACLKGKPVVIFPDLTPGVHYPPPPLGPGPQARLAQKVASPPPAEDTSQSAATGKNRTEPARNVQDREGPSESAEKKAEPPGNAPPEHPPTREIGAHRADAQRG